MSVRLVVAITDTDWFEHLRARPTLDEVNFWAPSATPFKALQPGELFLFKLHAPYNFIVGGGVFAYANTLPTSLAWEAFGEKNGASSLLEMKQRIGRYRRSTDNTADFKIGCRVLTQPFFLEESQWISISDIWPGHTQVFKTYSTDEAAGKRLWELIQQRFIGQNSISGFEDERPRYGAPILVRPRLGQGAFRVLVTDSYDRKCAVSGEKTLPALDAAHIKPFAEGGSHDVRNGILLRRDIHSLFDAGYVTVTRDGRFEVSARIKAEFENGRHYYALHGQEMLMPQDPHYRPDPELLGWHNDNKFLRT